MSTFIRIQCEHLELVLQVPENKRLYQSYLGQKLLCEADLPKIDWWIKPGSDMAVCQRGWEVAAGSGYEDFFEPCVAVTHEDGNPCTIFE